MPRRKKATTSVSFWSNNKITSKKALGAHGTKRDHLMSQFALLFLFCSWQKPVQSRSMRPKDAFLHFTEQRQCKTCPATSSNGPTTQCQRYDRDLSRIKRQDVPIFRMTITFLSSFRSYAPICVCRGMKSSRVKPFEVSANYTNS